MIDGDIKLKFTRFRLSEEATKAAENMKMRTGLTPNILCRFALMYSINEPRIPDPSLFDSNGMEINRFTLLGEWDSLFIAIMKERCLTDGLNLEKDLFPQFRAHIHRGLLSMTNFIKSITDITKLVPSEIASRFETYD